VHDAMHRAMRDAGCDAEGDAVSLLGGKESSFIFDCAFKIILSHLATIPRSNFLFIDEGISVFERNWNLLDFLKGQYDYIFLMSHLEKMKDVVDEKILVTNDGGKSLVRT
jgi:DNA repair exonuclease SbcCD ATPase subunit